MAPPKPSPKGLPKWAWPAAIAGGLVIGFVFLRKGGDAAPSEVVGTLGDGSGFNAAAPPQQAAQGGSDIASVLGALGLLGDQIGALNGSLQQYYGSGGTSQPSSGGGAESGGGVVSQAQAESQSPSPAATLQSEFGTTNGVTNLPSYAAESPLATRNMSMAPASSGFQVSGGAGAGQGSGGALEGVQWGGQTFTTRSALSSWLSARGANYATWAANHPAAAAKLK